MTGASSGIGRAVGIELARRGWDVGLLGRNHQRLEETAASCREHLKDAPGRVVVAGAFDIGDRVALGQFLDGFGTVDLYVSNHGILDGRRAGEVLESPEVARSVLETNLMASIDALHAILPGMRARKRGQIVLVTSLAGLSPLADAPAYSASKAGLVAYGLGLRAALHGAGVGVTTVCPGYVATPMGATHIGNRPHEVSPEKAAHLIIRAGLANRRLVGFPFPLWPMALFSLMVPEKVERFVTRSLRFAVEKRGR